MEPHECTGLSPQRLATLRRNEFPVTRQLAYLNHAAVSPLPARSVQAMQQAAAEVGAFGASRYGELVRRTEQTRELAARLLGAEPGEIAFVPSTSHGLSLVAFGLDWRPGDNLVLSAHEFPSNVYPWWVQQDRGVEVRTAPAPRGWVGADDIAPLLDARTRVVALSSVQYATGGRTDLAAVAELCHSKNVLFCVDAIQSLGVLPLDVHGLGIDLLAADGHKWLLGPEGVGLFFCARRNLERLRLSVAGWRSVERCFDFDRLELKLQPDARRFEPGSQDRIATCGLGASLELLLELGLPALEERVELLTERLVEGLARRNRTCRSPRTPRSCRSGIVTFSSGEEEPAQAVQRLLGEGIFVSARQGGLRASPHFYNSEEEIDRLLAALR